MSESVNAMVELFGELRRLHRIAQAISGLMSALPDTDTEDDTTLVKLRGELRDIGNLSSRIHKRIIDEDPSKEDETLAIINRGTDVNVVDEINEEVDRITRTYDELLMKLGQHKHQLEIDKKNFDKDP